MKLATTLVLSLSFVATGFTGETIRVWVRFAPEHRFAVRGALGQAAGKIHHEFDDLGAVAVTLPAHAVDAIRRNPNVELVEEDPIRELSAQTVPYGVDKVQAREVWDAIRDGIVDAGAPTGAGCKVCVIDSGVYAGHEDLAGLTMTGEPAGWNSDLCGHGTHVVGTIVAANNNVGVVGVTPGTTPIHMVKVFGDNCSWAYSSDLVYAARRCQTRRLLQSAGTLHRGA